METSRQNDLAAAAIPDTASLDARRAALEQRLEDGYRRIDEAALAGVDVSGWESFWLQLLHEYEGVCRERDLAA
jgi:hypothetical protein